MTDTKQRNGDWFVTFTGQEFYPWDMRVEDINIKDIAHSLALQCRWMGHCRKHYSVATHSLACARVAEIDDYHEDTVHWCLMHDASEAYIGDIVRPIKRYLCLVNKPLASVDEAMRPFKELEDALLQLIAERFKLPWPMPDAVHEIDNRMLVTEALALTNYQDNRHWVHQKNWSHIKPYEDHVLIHQTMETAEAKFRERAQEYLQL